MNTRIMWAVFGVISTLLFIANIWLSCYYILQIGGHDWLKLPAYVTGVALLAASVFCFGKSSD